MEKRRKLLRVDRCTILEQARKNQYCSKCHGLLVERFALCVQQSREGVGRVGMEAGPDEVGMGRGLGDDVAEDSRWDLWGGLAAASECVLTLKNEFVTGTPLEVRVRFYKSRGVLISEILVS